ncbi:MAG: JDVT-CTERM system glutamic-type intramembrane protease [Halospina sp.]
MNHSSIPQTLGLSAAPGLTTDRLFWLALVAGLILSVLLAAAGLTGMPQGMSAYTLFSLLLWYPVIEELAFRGVLQGSLAETEVGRRARLGISVANLGATFAFVLWHLLYQGSVVVVALAIPSLVFGFFRDRYDSLAPALLLHSLYNGFFVIAHWLYS